MGLRLVFADLDDTLFSTPRKQSEPSVCTPVSWDPEGRPSGVASPTQKALWTWLEQWGEVVPVTTRMLHQLERVSLKFAPHAVWNHGASIRMNGVRDEVWHARTLSVLEPLQDVFRCLTEDLAAAGSWPAAVVREQSDLDGRVGRLILKQKGSNLGARAAELRARVGAVAPAGSLWVHAQRDNLAILPCGLTKRGAVRHLIDVLRPTSTVGIGDSPSDVPFMRECDFCMFPRQSLALETFGNAEEDAA